MSYKYIKYTSIIYRSNVMQLQRFKINIIILIITEQYQFKYIINILLYFQFLFLHGYKYIFMILIVTFIKMHICIKPNIILKIIYQFY